MGQNIIQGYLIPWFQDIKLIGSLNTSEMFNDKPSIKEIVATHVTYISSAQIMSKGK